VISRNRKERQFDEGFIAPNSLRACCEEVGDSADFADRAGG
jgi:hypothetical protein